MAQVVTRFAPSPTGPLHLGHAFSALLAHDYARAKGGQFLLRIEDIDQTRSRPMWEAHILDDLTWLGIRWDAPPLRQSDHLPSYRAALQTLWDRGLLYPCHCNRRDILAAASAPQEGAPLLGPDGVIYPGTCRPNHTPTGPLPGPGVALRLNMAHAMQVLGDPSLTYIELGDAATSAVDPVQTIGDIVLSRRDFIGSYHLSVTCDDAAAQITHVIRGADLAQATPIHVLLQKLLGLPTPAYWHHRLIRDDQGKRLAKRDDAAALYGLRTAGATAQDIRRMVGL